jgi:hypothetical protein
MSARGAQCRGDTKLGTDQDFGQQDYKMQFIWHRKCIDNVDRR